MTPRSSPPARLEQLRAEIQRLDEALVRLIAERTRVAREARVAKRDAGLPLVDTAREAAVVRRAGTLAGAAGLPSEDVREIFWRLIALSRSVQVADDAAAQGPPSPGAGG
jgi:chorismate mutase